MNRVTDLARLRYWKGQRLQSSDFLVQNESSDELRWWHNRAFHRALGIAEGLAVHWLPDEAVPTGVRVDPGIAYDGYGRELLLHEPVELALPEIDERKRATLVLRYRSATEPSATAEVVWLESDRISRCAGIPLAAAASPASQMRSSSVRALSRPRLATGETLRTNTPWEAWKVKLFDGFGIQEIPFGIETRVNTTAAGYTITPHYFASAVWNSERQTFAPAMFGHVADATTSGFTYRLLLKGIARQVLAVAHGVALSVDAAEGGRAVKLDDAAAFAARDRVVRLDPVMRQFASVKRIDGNVVELSGRIAPGNEKIKAAHAGMPVAATVDTVRDKLMRVELVADPGLSPGALMVALNETGQPVSPVIVDEVSGANVILRQPVLGLRKGDKLAPVDPVAKATSVAGKRIVIDTAGAFAVGDVLVALPGNLELAQTAIVEQVEGDGVTLDLRQPVPVLANGVSVGKPSAGFEIKSVRQFSATVTVKDDTVPFTKGDVVCRPASATPAAAVVVSVRDKSMVLDRALDGLAKGDIIAAASLRRRTSVIAVTTAPLFSIQVGSAAGIVSNDLIFAIDATRAFTFLGIVDRVAANVITLSGTASAVSVGDVVAAVRAPAFGDLVSTSDDGLTVELTMLGQFVAGDAVAITGVDNGEIAMVDTVTASGIRLRRALDGLQAGSRIATVETRASFTATPEADAQKYSVEHPESFRVGDKVGPATAWRATSVDQVVTGIDDSTLRLAGNLDGLLVGDAIGAADFTADRAQLRLESVEGLMPADQIAFGGENTMTGRFGITLGVIDQIDSASRSVQFTVSGNPHLRPEAMSAAALYHSRFSDTFSALARKEGLYVTWFACQPENRDPAACPEDEPEPTRECAGKEED